MSLTRIKFSFISAVNKIIVFTGPVERPTETYDITSQINEAIIGIYLTKPGIIVGPDGSEFMLELTLLPASLQAKQKLIDDAQATINAAKHVNVPEPAQGSKEWQETAWARNLTESDKALFKRIAKVRANGQRVTFHYGNPSQFKVNIGPAPKKPKEKIVYPEPEPFVRGDLKWKDSEKKGVEFVANPDGLHFFAPSVSTKMIDGNDSKNAANIFGFEKGDAYEGPLVNQHPSDEDFMQQRADFVRGGKEILAANAAKRVPVVVLTIPEANTESFIVERTRWNEYGGESLPSGRPWLDVCIENFCKDNGLSPDDITNVDFDQTRTREELDTLPDFQF